MPLLYAILLYCCSGPIQLHHPSPLSRAIRFPWSDYEDDYYWYEMVLLTKKLVRESSGIVWHGLSSKPYTTPVADVASQCSTRTPHA